MVLRHFLPNFCHVTKILLFLPKTSQMLNFLLYQRKICQVTICFAFLAKIWSWDIISHALGSGHPSWMRCSSIGEGLNRACPSLKISQTMLLWWASSWTSLCPQLCHYSRGYCGLDTLCCIPHEVKNSRVFFDVNCGSPSVCRMSKTAVQQNNLRSLLVVSIDCILIIGRISGQSLNQSTVIRYS